MAEFVFPVLDDVDFCVLGSGEHCPHIYIMVQGLMQHMQVVFGTVVTRGPRSPLAQSAMAELEQACILFSKASVYSIRAMKALVCCSRVSYPFPSLNLTFPIFSRSSLSSAKRPGMPLLQRKRSLHRPRKRGFSGTSNTTTRPMTSSPSSLAIRDSYLQRGVRRSLPPRHSLCISSLVPLFIPLHRLRFVLNLSTNSKQ